MIAQETVSQRQPGREFAVAVIGANKNDLDILHRIFGITHYRQRSYRLLSIDEPESRSQWARARQADIYMINTSNAKAVLCWHRFTNGGDAGKRKPVLQLSHKVTGHQSVSDLVIPCPINPSRLLQTLDNYTIRHLDYYPEFQIGENASSENLVPMIPVKRAEPPPATSDARQLRVLVADDSLAVRRQLTLEFEAMNAQLDTVEDGEGAVDAAEIHAYDLILMDVVMPGMDGYTACKQIRRSPLNKHTPVIMLTSRSSRFDKLKGILAGCDTYLTKPVNHNEFKAITQKHLAQQTEKNHERQ